MGTARMNQDKETDQEGTKRGVSVKKSKAGTKKMSRKPITTKSKYNINKHDIYSFIRYGKSTMKLNKQKLKWT